MIKFFIYSINNTNLIYNLNSKISLYYKGILIKEKANKLNKSNHASKGFHFSENINNLYNKKLNIQIFAKPR